MKRRKGYKNIKISYLHLTLYLGKQKKVCSALKDETTNDNISSAKKREEKCTNLSRHNELLQKLEKQTNKKRDAIFVKELV